MKYRQLGENLSHASSDNYWDLIGCTPRCKFTKYKLKPMVEGTNDENKIMMKKPDGANIEVNSKGRFLSESAMNFLNCQTNMPNHYLKLEFLKLHFVCLCFAADFQANTTDISSKKSGKIQTTSLR